MSKNWEFGHRVMRARNDLGMRRQRLAELLRVEDFRLENIETGQMDESDLTEEELQRLHEALHRSRCWFLHGEDQSHGPRCQPSSSVLLPARVVAQRSRPEPTQRSIDFGWGSCPHCRHTLPVSSSRRGNCGHPLE